MARLSHFVKGDALRARAARGSIFTAVLFAGRNALRLGSNLILTRILFPEAFGLMALVHVFVTGLQMFSDLGLNTSIIRSRRGDDPTFLNTAWTIQILRGLVLWVATVATAGVVANFYDEPLLKEILPLIGITTVISGFASVNLFLAQRNLVLGRFTTFELGTQFVSASATILLAVILESVWALVLGAIFHSIIHASLSHFVFPGVKVRFSFEMEAVKELFHFGKWIFLSTIAGFFIHSGDKAILGRFVSISDLAFYNIAFVLSAMPSALNSAMVSAVLFPLYCNGYSRDSKSNYPKILKARFFLTASTIVICLPFVFYGAQIVELLYDPRYYDAGPIVIAIALISMLRIITSGHTQILLAVGDSRNFAMLLTVSALLRMSLMYYGASQFGILGVVAAIFVSEIVMYPYILKKTFHFGTVDIRQDVFFFVFFLLAALFAYWFNPFWMSEFLALSID